MNPTDAHYLALELMERHGLIATGWRPQLDGAKRRFGLCDYRRKIISLSRPLVERNSIEQVTDTILHEIAHALVGGAAGHGPAWKRKAREVGANPSRCYDGEQVNAVPAKWTGWCRSEGCDFRVERHRLSRNTRETGACPKCIKANGGRWSLDFVLAWRDNRIAA